MNITVLDVSEYLDGWKKYDENYGWCLCPFHDDHNPSCRITASGYRCYSCGAKGNLLQLYNSVSGRFVTREKIYNPADYIWRNWEEKFGSIKNIAKVAHEQLKYNPNLAHYLVQRKIDSQIKSGMIGFLDGYYLFPVKDEWEEVMGIIARASPTIQTKTNRYSVSKCPIKLYVPNWRKVLKDDELYICFGILDSWSLLMAGYASISGISGQEFNAEHLERFRKPIYIIPDRGEENKALELQCKLGWRGKTLLLDYPEGSKDVNDVHMKMGLDFVSGLIEKQKEKYIYV